METLPQKARWSKVVYVTLQGATAWYVWYDAYTLFLSANVRTVP